jgi:hypothetical protein
VDVTQLDIFTLFTETNERRKHLLVTIENFGGGDKEGIRSWKYFEFIYLRYSTRLSYLEWLNPIIPTKRRVDYRKELESKKKKEMYYLFSELVSV